MRSLRIVLLLLALAALAGCAAPAATRSTSPRGVLRGTVRLPDAEAVATVKGASRSSAPAGARKSVASGTAAASTTARKPAGSTPAKGAAVKPSARAAARAQRAGGKPAPRGVVGDAVVYAEAAPPPPAAAPVATSASRSARATTAVAPAPAVRRSALAAAPPSGAATRAKPASSVPAKAAIPVVPPRTHVIAQRPDGFAPRVLAVTLGDTVAFENRDKVFHNAFSVSPARTFDLGKLGPKASKRLVFAKPGVVRVFCDLHPEDAAYVFVAPTHQWARPDTSGTWTLGPLPVGDYVLRAWHPEHGDRKWSVSLPREGRAVDVTF